MDIWKDVLMEIEIIESRRYEFGIYTSLHCISVFTFSGSSVRSSMKFMIQKQPNRNIWFNSLAIIIILTAARNHHNENFANSPPPPCHRLPPWPPSLLRHHMQSSLLHHHSVAIVPPPTQKHGENQQSSKRILKNNILTICHFFWQELNSMYI